MGGGEPGRGGQPGGFGSEGARRSEGDLLAERRARRAAESGEVALTRRAEAAEATVQTLERHVASLQQRVREAEEQRLRAAELLEVEKAAALERENELRLVKQREYAEQQLRVEAEQRASGGDRASQAESERLSRRLGDSEAAAQELGARLHEVQRQLAEAERAAAEGRAELRRAEQDLQVRVGELEARAAQMQRGLDAERAARQRSEAQLATIGRGQVQMQRLLGDMKAIVERLTGAIGGVQRRSGAPAVEASSATVAVAPSGPGAVPSASAVEPRAPAVAPSAAAVDPSGATIAVGPRRTFALPERPAPGAAAASAPAELQGAARGGEMADALAAAVERLRARAEAATFEPRPAPERPPAQPPHKHSMSLIGRWRVRRKQRRSR